MDTIKFKSGWTEKCIYKVLNNPDGILTNKKISKIYKSRRWLWRLNCTWSC